MEISVYHWPFGVWNIPTTAKYSICLLLCSTTRTTTQPPHGESSSNPPATYKFIPAGSFGLTAQNKLEVGLEHFSLFIS